MICSSEYRFFTSNLHPGLDSKPKCYSKAGGRRIDNVFIEGLWRSVKHEEA